MGDGAAVAAVLQFCHYPPATAVPCRAGNLIVGEAHMGMTSIWHWLVVLLIVLVLFGAGKIPRLMGDLA